MDARSHESDERLEHYALGRLPDSDLIGIEEHLLICEACRERLDANAGVAFLIRNTLLDNSVPLCPGRFEWIAARFEWISFPWLRPQLAFGPALAIAFLAVVLIAHANSRMPPVASLQLTAMRGADVPTVPPARELDLMLGDAAGAVRVEVVDGDGALVWSGRPNMTGGVARAKVVKALTPGEYFARAYDSPDHMLHEYGFQVRPRN